MTSASHDFDAAAANPGTPETGLPPSDAELISSARTGDVSAYDQLFHRHEGAVRVLARCLQRKSVEPLVLQTYTKAFAALRSGAGPDAAFRAYLLGILLAYQTPEGMGREFPREPDAIDRPDRSVAPTPVTPKPDPAADVLGTYANLSLEWQTVLWQSEVDNDPPEQLALSLAITTSEAWDARRRARNVLRQAACAAHAATVRPRHCRFAIDRLDSFRAGDLIERELVRVREHLASCPRCNALNAQLQAIDERLRDILASAVLGRYASSYLTRPAMPPTGRKRLLRLRSLVRGRRGAALASATGALAIAIAAMGLASFLGGGLQGLPDADSRTTLPERPGELQITSKTGWASQSTTVDLATPDGLQGSPGSDRATGRERDREPPSNRARGSFPLDVLTPTTQRWTTSTVETPGRTPDEKLPRLPQWPKLPRPTLGPGEPPSPSPSPTASRTPSPDPSPSPSTSPSPSPSASPPSTASASATPAPSSPPTETSPGSPSAAPSPTEPTEGARHDRHR